MVSPLFIGVPHLSRIPPTCVRVYVPDGICKELSNVNTREDVRVPEQFTPEADNMVTGPCGPVKVKSDPFDWMELQSIGSSNVTVNSSKVVQFWSTEE